MDNRMFNVRTYYVHSYDCTGRCADTVRVSALKVDPGRKSLAELGSRTCVSGVLVRRSTNVFTEIGKFGYQRGKIKRFVVVVYNQMLRLKQKTSDLRKRFPHSQWHCRYPRSTVGWQRLPSCPSFQSTNTDVSVRIQSTFQLRSETMWESPILWRKV